MINNKLVSIAYLVLCSVTYLSAQKIEFGIGVGVTHFKGDISPKFNPLQMGYGANALFRYNLSRSISVRSQIMLGNYNVDDLKTKDDFYITRAANATGSLMEVSLLADYNFMNLTNISKHKEWTPYLFGGLGFAKISNKSYINNPPLKASTIVIPYGLGVKYRFKGPFSVCAEFGTKYTFSDDLDKVFYTNFGAKNPPSSGVLNDKNAFSDTSRKDQYYYTNITLTYTIFNIVCDK